MRNLTRQKSRINKEIKKCGTSIAIKRAVLNEFNEPFGEEVVTEVLGLYFKEKKTIRLSVEEKGAVKVEHEEKLMVSKSQESLLIQEHDYFELNGIKYEIIDLGDTFGIYYDMTLKRVI